MILRELLRFKRVAIQCHDNPDADALASGYALSAFLKAQGIKTHLFYGGRSPITKPNLVEMIKALDIPAAFEPDHPPIENDEILVTVDCQYGAGNVSPVPSSNVAVIDHHIQEIELPVLSDVRPFLGSCSTLVWELLRKLGFVFSPALSTALYYGLCLDTDGFAEVRHPLDRDMRDSLEPDLRTIKKLMRCNLTLGDLSQAGASLSSLEYDESGRFVLMEARSCDPNILGFICDLAMQVDKVDIAIVFFQENGGIKYSVRTATREAKAAELAVWLSSGGIGSGGGHVEKAGGHINMANYLKVRGNTKVMDFFKESMKSYLAAYDIVDCDQLAEDYTRDMKAYRKLPVPVGHAPCGELFPGRATLHVRMLEGDINIQVDGDTYLMIGIAGEVYPIHKDKFTASYEATSEKFAPNLEYPPVVLNWDTGQRIPLLHVAKSCVGKGGLVWAKRLDRGAKVFTLWDRDSYFLGEPSDWLVSSFEDSADVYVVKAALFPSLYAPADGNGP